MQTKLIILRGPSGSGKSTIMAELKKRSSRKTATIEGDVTKHSILHSQDGAKELAAKICGELIKTALDGGYDVIAEGIFGQKSYSEMFDDILKHHPDEINFYWLDVSFEETLKRHQTRNKKGVFGAGEIERLYSKTSALGYEFEKKISEDTSLDQIVNYIIDDAKLYQ